MMNRELLCRQLDLSRDAHIPMPIDEEEFAEARIAKKPVSRFHVVHDGESLEGWSPVTWHVNEAVGTSYEEKENWRGLAEVTLSGEHVRTGAHSIRFSCPTNLEKLNAVAPGRIYAVPTAFLAVDREDWSGYNLLSAWVYPVAKGIKTITLRM